METIFSQADHLGLSLDQSLTFQCSHLRTCIGPSWFQHGSILDRADWIDPGPRLNSTQAQVGSNLGQAGSQPGEQGSAVSGSVSGSGSESGSERTLKIKPGPSPVAPREKICRSGDPRCDSGTQTRERGSSWTGYYLVWRGYSQGKNMLEAPDK